MLKLKLAHAAFKDLLHVYRQELPWHIPKYPARDALIKEIDELSIKVLNIPENYDYYGSLKSWFERFLLNQVPPDRHNTETIGVLNDYFGVRVIGAIDTIRAWRDEGDQFYQLAERFLRSQEQIKHQVDYDYIVTLPRPAAGEEWPVTHIKARCKDV